MTKPLIRKTAYKTLKQDDLLLFTENVLHRMSSKPEYQAYASVIARLGQQLLAYKEALSGALNRGIDDIARKKEIRLSLLQTLDQIAEKLNLDHNGLESWALNAGMEVIRPKQRHPETLQAPTNLQVLSSGNRGEAILRFKTPEPRRVSNNSAEYSLDNGETWNHGAYSTSRKIHIKGIPSRQTIQFRVCSIGTAQRKSAWTEAVEMFVL